MSTTNLEGWRGAFQDFTRDHGYEPLRVEGRLPEDLSGTLLRVGPVVFGVGGRPYGHWFDGDGGVLAVRFGGGQAQGAARRIETPSIRADRAAGRLGHSLYGSTVPWWRRLTGKVPGKNAANTSVMAWNGRFYALYEAGVPTELSTEDLRTLAETDLGVIVHHFSAHPHHVPERHTSYNFGMRYGRTTLLDLYALPDGAAARYLGAVPLPGATMIHDFIATPRHLVFFVSPLRLNIPRMLLGLGAFAENLEWKAALGTQVLVVPIDDLSRPLWFETEPFFAWHFGNAFERGEELVVDYVRHLDFGTHRWLQQVGRGGATTDTGGVLHRATLNLQTRTFRSEERSTRACEFPRVAPAARTQEHRHLYVSAYTGAGALRGPHDAVGRVDMHTGQETLFNLGPAGQYVSEPVFTPRAHATRDDDGYVLTQVYDAPSRLTHVAVLDARAPDAPPLARVWFEHAFPLTFHGDFVPTA